MNPGELDRRIEIQSYTTSVQLGNNEEQLTYSSYGFRWAKFEIISASEVESEDMLNTYMRADFTIRYERNDGYFNEGYRVIYDNKVYNILGIETIGRKDYMKLICETRSLTKFKT